MTEPSYDGILEQHTLERIASSLEHAETEFGWRQGIHVCVTVGFPDAVTLQESTRVNAPSVEERIRRAAERVINTIRRAQGEDDCIVALINTDPQENVVRLVHSKDEDPA